MKKFKEVRKPLNTEKYDAYYAMVDAKKMAKKKGGKPEDYIDAMMKKRGYKKDTYSGHGVWKWVKEETVKEGTMKSGIFDSDIRKRKDAARKLVFFLKAKRNQKIGPMDDNTGSNKAIDAYIKELMKYVFDDEMIDDLYPTGKNANKKANDVVVKRLKKMGVKVK